MIGYVGHTTHEFGTRPPVEKLALWTKVEKLVNYTNAAELLSRNRFACQLLYDPGFKEHLSCQISTGKTCNHRVTEQIYPIGRNDRLCCYVQSG